MKKIFYMAVLMCLPILFTGCEKRVINTDVTISGTVRDVETSAPIQNAIVTLQPSGRSRTTGSDGAFQFDNLDISVGQYTVGAQAEGYGYNKKMVTLSSGESSFVDILLKKEK